MTIRLVGTSISIFMFISCTSIKETSTSVTPYDQERILIITADDFGASRNINEGIKIAADKKAITAISVLSNFTESLPELKEISENHPDIGIGIHLNIVTGRPILDTEQIPSLVNPGGSFYTINELLPRIKSISIDDLRKELRAQILAVAKYDIKIDHLSYQFGILSIYTPFFEIVTELAREFSVPVRTPLLASVKFPETFPNSHMNKRGYQIAFRFAITHPFKAIGLLKYSRNREMERKAEKLDDLGILHPDYLIDYFWGDPTAANFLYILEHLPAGISELMLHLGTYSRQDNYPVGLDVEYFENRENELITVTSDYLKEYINYLNIISINYSEISDYKNK